MPSQKFPNETGFCRQATITIAHSLYLYSVEADLFKMGLSKNDVELLIMGF